MKIIEKIQNLNFDLSDLVNAGTAHHLLSTHSVLSYGVMLNIPPPSQGAVDNVANLVATFLITVATKIIFGAIDKIFKKVQKTEPAEVLPTDAPEPTTEPTPEPIKK